ncbi:hypothetical protein D3C80_2028720 [compost metagenome]
MPPIGVMLKIALLALAINLYMAFQSSFRSPFAEFQVPNDNCPGSPPNWQCPKSVAISVKAKCLVAQYEKLSPTDGPFNLP